MEEKYTNPKISEMTKLLEDCFNKFNKKYFDYSLPEVSILIQTKGNRKGVLGWFTTRKMWTDNTGDHKRYEITVTAEYLNRPVSDILGTLLHEMVHLYCQEEDLRDTSRQGRYHNETFKEQSEAHGLDVGTKHKVYGHTFTSLTENAFNKKLIKQVEGKNIFTLSRVITDPVEPGQGEDKIKRKKITITYKCPNCGEGGKFTILEGFTPKIDIACNDCGVRCKVNMKVPSEE